jgi:hypothetical protein
MRKLVLTAACVALCSSTAFAQTVGIGIKGGTLGVGGDLAVQLHERVGVRAGIGIFPLTPKFNVSDIRWAIDLPSPQYSAMLDLFLLGPLRLTGGVMLSPDDIIVDADLSGVTTTVDIGGTAYQVSDVGTLTGVIVNKDIAPYAGIGLGRVGGRGLGFFLDAGVAFQGAPTVTLSSSGGTLSGNAVLNTALNTESGQIEDAVDLIKYYPVLQLGIRYGF